jgi:hypothetical protein
MKKLVMTVMLATCVASAFAQTEIAVTAVNEQLSGNQPVTYENKTITGDWNAWMIEGSVETGQYPENGKTAIVYTRFVNQPVTFRNCTFKGALNFCHKVTEGNVLKEYRVDFLQAVSFENCVFEKTTDWELVNFNQALSFANSTFKERPRLARMGIYQKPNLSGLVLQKNCLFQFDQTKKTEVFTVAELTKTINSVL